MSNLAVAIMDNRSTARKLADRLEYAWCQFLWPLFHGTAIWLIWALRMSVSVVWFVLTNFWKFLYLVTAVGALALMWMVYRVLASLSDFVAPVMAESIGRSPPTVSPPPVMDQPGGEIEVWFIVNLIQFAVIIFLILKPNKKVYRVCEHGFRVEGVRASSAFVTAPPPDFIGEVWVKFSRFGPSKREATIFRVGEYLYTADHVFRGVDRAWVKFNGKFLELDLSTGQQIDTDIRRFPYQPLSALQMGAGKFSKTFCSQIVNVHNGDVTSMGKVTLGDSVGMVDYDGSTLPSFSGSPYYLGRTVFGVHVGSGMLNVGVDGSMLNSLISYYRPESDSFTTDYQEQLADEFRKHKGQVQYRRTANDYYVVKVGGKYYTYGEEEFEAAQEQYEIEATHSTYPRYKGESVSAAQLAELSVDLDVKPAVVAPKRVLPKLLDAIPEETGMFTVQDSENCQWPAADVILPAGPSKEPEPEPVQKPVTPPPSPIVSSPSPLKLPSSMAGLKRQVAQQKFLSAITYDTLSDWLKLTEQLERDGITPTKAEMDVLRTLWLGLSPQKSEAT